MYKINENDDVTMSLYHYMILIIMSEATKYTNVTLANVELINDCS